MTGGGSREVGEIVRAAVNKNIFRGLWSAQV